MRKWVWLAAPLAVVGVDIAALALGAVHVSTTSSVGLAVIGHFLVSAVYGAVVSVALSMMGVLADPSAAGGRRAALVRVTALAMSVAFFVPVLGAIALVATFYTLFVTKPKVEAAPLVRYAPPGALERQPLTELRPRVLAERLVYLVRWGQSLDTRFKAVLSTNDAPAVVAVPVLKAALADAAEEVRLSAFSQLEKTRRAIDLRIERGRESLKDEVSSGRKHSVNASLAQDYFEVAYLGLAEGEVYKHTLKASLAHAREALALVPDDAATLRLVGRVLMRQTPEGASTDEAREAFDASAAAGMPAAELVSDYAEEAYRRRAFDEVGRILEATRHLAHDHVVLAKVHEFWRWP